MVTWVEPKNRYQLFWLGFKWNPCTVLLLKPGKIKELYKSTYNIYIYVCIHPHGTSGLDGSQQQILTITGSVVS